MQQRSLIYILLVTIIASALTLIVVNHTYTPYPHIIQPPHHTPSYTYTLAFGGDVMLDRGVESKVEEYFNGEYSQLFNVVQPTLHNADISFINLEGPISDRGTNQGSKYSFRMNPAVITTLQTLGIDIVSFANNHVGDWGMTAFTDTLEHLTTAGIAYTGAGYEKDEATGVKTITLPHATIGYLAFSDVGPAWMEAGDDTPGIALADQQTNVAYIQNAQDDVDILIVSYHFGEEYSEASERQKQLARNAIDAGADIVIGHHPHVTQEIVPYNGGLIAYSLGNFMFDQYFSKETLRGALLSVEIKKDQSGVHIKNYTPHTTIQDDETYRIAYLLDEEGAVTLPYKRGPCPYGEGNSPHAPISRTQDISPQYTPASLVHISPVTNTLNRTICITEETAAHIDDLLYAAHQAGHKLAVTSGYRSYTTQEKLYQAHLTEQRERIAETDILGVAPPGHSEHQLGTAIDITAKSIDYAPASLLLGQTEAGAWLEENAHTFGFILSYPEGKENVTGYKYEPWHFRYVGDIAPAVYESTETLSQYLMQ